jgi:hypothetical protein
LRSLSNAAFLLAAVASAPGCKTVRSYDTRQPTVEDAPVPAPVASVDASPFDAPPPVSAAPPSPEPRAPLGAKACKERLSRRQALIARGKTKCAVDEDCGTYVDARHPCGDGSVDITTALEVHRIDEELVGDDCYSRVSGGATCHITPYPFQGRCAPNGRCAVK